MLLTAPAKLATGQSQSAEESPAASPCYIDRELTRQDVEGWSLRTLSLARNAVYARVGFEFETPWLDEHFRTHEWYEPGDFHADAIPNRDKQNAKLIREYEENLTLKELRTRQRIHWKQKGGVPEAGWLPSVWEKKEPRRKALLLSEAIAERSDSLRPGVPWGFGEHFRLGGSVEQLPEAFEAPTTPDTWFQTSVREAVLEEWGSRVAAHVDSSGRLEHVVAELRVPISESKEWDVSGDFGYLHREVQRIIDRLGEPSDSGNYWKWGEVENIEPVRWDAGSHVAEVWPVFGCCLEQDAFLSIHTGTPDRTCGPEDGFDEWFEEFEDVLDGGDPKEIVDYFHFPFGDNGISGIPTVAKKYSRTFKNRQSFLKEVPAEHPLRPTDQSIYEAPWSLALDDPPDLSCHPYHGYRASTSSGGSYVFHRVNGTWKATGIE